MRTTWILVGAIILSSLLAVGAYVAYDQHRKTLVREYYEAVAEYREYLRSEQVKDQSEDSAFAIKANELARAAYSSRGESGMFSSRQASEAENTIRLLERKKKKLERVIAGPPPKEYLRFQEAAKRAAMPLSID